MRPRISNARTTTPPIVPPAMAPALRFEVEPVVTLVVVPGYDDADAAAAAADDDATAPAAGDAVGSAGVWVVPDWSDTAVVALDGVVGSEGVVVVVVVVG